VADKKEAAADKKEAAAGKSDPVAEAQSAVDGVAEGWRVDHAQAAQIATTEGGAVVSVRPAEYRAWKRSPAGDTLIEVTGDSQEQLAARIEGWEASQNPTEPGQPSEEQIMNSAKATLHMSTTADARPAVDVDVRTEPDPKAEPAQKRLVVETPIKEVELDKEQQTLKQPASTGVGTGTGGTAASP
jgi:hypothetical protein